MKRYITIISALAMTIGVSAQDLHKEITVDRTVQPNIREASRLNGVTPTILQPEIQVSTLYAAEYTDPGEVTPDLSVLPPAAWSDSVERTPYRGYASVGYLPLFNMGANVGYRFLDKHKYGLGLWAQYNGNSYKGDMPYYEDALYANHIFTIGGSGYMRFGKNSLLTASGNITLKSIRQPYYVLANAEEVRRSYDQSAKDLGAKAKWESKVGRTVYNIKGELGYFDLGHDIPKEISIRQESVRQALVAAGGGIGLADDGTMQRWIGVDADVKVLRSTCLPELMTDFRPKMIVANQWLFSLKPFLRFDNDVLEGLVGFNLNAGKGYGGKLKIAPEFQLTYRPMKLLAMYANLSGGQYLNMMSHLFDINPYLLPTEAYGRTNMPIILRGGINVGPYEGMSLSLYGGYAKARGYLSPLITIETDGHMISTFEKQNVNSWHFGADITYCYKQLFELWGGIKYGRSDQDTNSWYEWIDGAKVVASVGLKVTPAKNWDMTLTYDMRYDRKCRSVIYPYNDAVSLVYIGVPNLGTINSVNVGGTYIINSQVTAFLQVENLLNTRYKLISGMAAPGIQGLLGVSCKF